MKKSLFFLLFVLSLVSCKEDLDKLTVKTSNDIVIGHVDSIYSNILDESRKVWIHIPQSTKESSNYKTKYPVVYLLDGPSHFSSVTGMIEQLSGNSIVPEMIIVGIENTNRSLDMTPTKVDIDFISGDSIPYESGGGDRFLDFIEKELIPYVEKTQPASDYRTLVGHSMGGLAVINALASRKEVFNNYIAIDPSLWWDNRAFLHVADSLLTINKHNDKALYVGVANTMEAGMTIDKVQSDSIADSNFTVHIKSILQFVKSLDNKTANGLNFKWKYYPDDDHGSVPFITEYDAFRFLFSWYKLKGVDDLFSEKSTLTAMEVQSLFFNHYEKISISLGYEEKPPQQLINSLSSAFLYNDMPKKANALLQLNLQNYPKNASVFDAMGDYYVFKSDTLKAIEYFKKALKIDETDSIKEKLKDLEQ